MRLSSACPTLLSSFAFAGLLATAMPAGAGDLSNGGAGGIRDYGSAGIPVPAPMPYEENFKWYLRGDIGTGFKHSGSIGVSGYQIDVNQPGNWHELSILSFGFGRYVTPSLRTEFTIDYRTDRTLASGIKPLPDMLKSAVTSAAGATPVSIQTNIYAGAQNEDMNYRNATFLMSAFYDFNRDGRLKPYVGAGIGLARHELYRNGTISYSCSDGFVTTGGVPGPLSGCATVSGTPGLANEYTTNTKKTATGWGLAAQASAGVTYDLTPRTHWDTGYRALWQSGRVSVASSDGLSTIKIQDRLDHEVRTGVRWDLW